MLELDDLRDARGHGPVSPLVSKCRKLDALSLGALSTIFTVYTLRRLLLLHATHADYASYGIDMVTVVGAGVALLAVSRAVSRGDDSPVLVAASGALLGLIFFVLTLGLGLANPTNVAWLLTQDWAAHFAGWHLFRNAAWQLPPGAFDTEWFPVGTSVVYTDSLPLLALPLKLLTPWLPPRTQYIGFWLLCNCLLQGTFGALLMRQFVCRPALQIIGAGLFVLAPIFIGRVGHDTLTTQWLLLAAFWLYFARCIPAGFLAWALLVAIAALVHPYLSVMVLIIAAAAVASAAVGENRMPLSRAAVLFANLVAITAVCWWISGAFVLAPGAGGVPLGVYNSNLLTWFDSQSLSRLFPALPHVGDGQYEGFGYLGAGVFLLVGVATTLVVVTGKARVAIPPVIPLLVAVAALTLFAFSTRVCIGSLVLIDFTPQSLPLLGAFRASGRFIWASVYLIMLAAMVITTHRANRFAGPILAAAFFVHLHDMSLLHVLDAAHRFVDTPDPDNVLKDPFWDKAVSGRSHITLVPPPACGVPAAPYLPFAILAGDHHMTLNSGYLARFDEPATLAYCAKLQAQLDSGHRDADSLYIVSAGALEHFRNASAAPISCSFEEGYNACIVD